jgi:ABC-type nitrate/sulfonate/bicarbonate transport system substrate-binding protein
MPSRGIVLHLLSLHLSGSARTAGPIAGLLFLLISGVGAAEPMALGIGTQPSAALLQIAVAQGLLQAEGIEPTVTRYPSGKRALRDGLFAGRAEVVSATEAPVVASAFERTDFVVVAAIFQADDVNSIIARRDAGITQPADLRGKRVATQRASAVHYFLHLFMLKHRIPHDDVVLSFLQAEALPRALADGTIDAFSMREPFIRQARARLGDNVVVFNEPGLYPQYELLVVDRAYLERQPERVRALLRALGKAHELLLAEPARAEAAVARFLKVDPAVMVGRAAGWRTEVMLSQALLLVMEFEAQWLIDDGLVDAAAIPNFLNFIDPAPLAAVAPAAVTMQH